MASNIDRIDPRPPRQFFGHVPSHRVFSAVPYRSEDLIPESQWLEFDVWPETIEIKDQNGYGACNGHAAATGLEIARYLTGQTHVPLSAWSVYAPLCNGVDRGSNIGDALALLSQKGCSTEAAVKYGTINPSKISVAAEAIRSRYKIEVGAMVTTREEIMSSVQRLRPINLAISVGGGFGSLDDEGVPRLGSIPCNHAVTVALGAKRSKSGRWLVKMPNSWGTAWGLKGFCWLPVDHLAGKRSFEGYEITVPNFDPGDTDKIPPLS